MTQWKGKAETESEATERRLTERIDYERVARVPYDSRRFNLDRMRWLLRRCGDPQRNYPIVHITGTKGKGSTAAMFESVFRTAGMRTGLFTSPHLTTVRERFRINGTDVDESTFIQICTEILDLVDSVDPHEIPSEQPPTYFEILTAVGMRIFAFHRVDVAILEVGLGGRFDATNVCDPELSIITSVDYDHCDQLGDTLGKIAYEKAGILRRGVPAIIGVTESDALEVIRRTAQENSTPLITAGQNYTFHYTPPRNLERSESSGRLCFRDQRYHLENVEISLPGSHQSSNAACVIAAISVLKQYPPIHPSIDTGSRYDREKFLRRVRAIPEKTIRRALVSVRWPGRIEVVQRRPTIVFDAAHNPVSTAALVRTLNESFEAKHRILVFAATQEKRLREMAEILDQAHFDTIILTRHSNTARSVNIDELKDIFTSIGRSRTGRMETDVPLEMILPATDAFRRAQKLAGPEDLICVTGSFYLLSDLRKESWNHQNP
ncbi:MAG: folylpolyglutamate synthase/dihydrofolate synthase family protein [Planctomycetia bacterium]|nr:folylpolyglutamate synthase/dihydrofolate synthase family protein [Planctomycetia bacterium]